MESVADVVFDFCGVLIDRQVTRTLEGAYSPEQIAEYFAYDDRSGFHYFDDLLDRGMGIEEAVARYEAERGAEPAAMFRCYYDHLDRGLARLMPGMEELACELRGAGVRLWGLTNWSAGGFPVAYERFPVLDELLEGVVVSGIEGVAKPDARIFARAIERFGLDPARTVFVDDNAINVHAACDAGMRGIPFIDAAHLRMELRSMGVDVSQDGGHVVCDAGEEGPCLADRSVHDGASSCATAGGGPGTSRLVPNNGEGGGVWRAVRLGDLVLPSASDPGRAVYHDDFWVSRCSEYIALQWQNMDWPFVRAELGRIAAHLAAHPSEQPEIELSYPTMRERTFLEMWFGYGDPCCEAVPGTGGRLVMGYGQHRICPVANYPLRPVDASRLGFPDGAFTAGDGVWVPESVPILVREG